MKFVIVALVLVAGILWLRSRVAPGAEERADRAYMKRKLQDKRRHSEALSHNPYAAVSIHPGPASCEAVRALRGRRFLPEEAPITPLADCNAAHCECRYIRHRDRRSGDDDRRAISLASAEMYLRSGKPERRKRAPGRRAADRGEEWGALA